MNYKNITSKLPLVLAISMFTSLASANKSQEAYQSGHMAMTQQNWTQAQQHFEQAAKDQSLADSATYWQAYVLYQNNRNGQAKLMVKKLLKEYPKSQWADDAHMLLLEHGDTGVPRPPKITRTTKIKSHMVPPVAPTTKHGLMVPPVAPIPPLDDEMRLFAIQQIMFNNPEKGLKLIKEMLEQSEGEASKSHALQLLGISHDKKAAELLFDFAVAAKNANLKSHAIQMLSMRQDTHTKGRMVHLYNQAKEMETKSAIIQGFIHGNDSKTLETLLSKEKNQELKLQMIHVMGIMGHSQALNTLYQTQDSKEVKAALLQAMAMAGESEEVKRVIAEEKAPEIRQHAINALMMIGDLDSDYLLDLYSKAKNQEEKHLISNVMMTSDLPPELAKKLYQNETDSEAKRSLLMLMMTSQSSQELAELYKGETDPQAQAEILQHIGMMQGVDELMSLYKDDPTIAKNGGFFMAFGMTDSGEHHPFLLEQFETGNTRTQQQILEVFMMQGDADPLVDLYKKATTKPMKKRILEMLVMTDADRVLDVIESP